MSKTIELRIQKKNQIGLGISKSGGGSYPPLTDKPSINDIVLLGNKTSAELGIIDDKFYTFTQLAPSSQWEINHPLDKFPSVTVVDSGGSVVIGDITYIDDSNIIIAFCGAFSGVAYLN